MILAIEIGNTNIVLGCIDENKIYFIERISSRLNNTDFEYAVQLKNLFDIYNIDVNNIEGTIISSVVPPMIELIKNAINKIIKKPIKVVGPGLKTGLNIKMDNPASVGTDLIINSVGALQKYQPPFLIISFGTATTISVIDKNGYYTGGTIMPGLETALDALVNSTAKLPQIRLEAPNKVIGHNTNDCMQSGTIIGAAAAVDGLIERIEAESAYKMEHISTGIYAKKVINHMNVDTILDEELSLRGLMAIYKKNK